MDARWLIERHAVLPSTMDRARELAEQGAPAGMVVVADYQSAGRGTHGRSWLAPPGACLMFTVVARPALTPTALERLPFRVSTTVAEVLREHLGAACTVHEPNDIYLHDRKVCGVLCTSHIIGDQVRWVLCGIGLNTHMTPEQLPLETATSLAAAGLTVPSHEELLPLLLDGLVWLLDDSSDMAADREQRIRPAS
jgi:BirA family biotin operon repressor/biotin-[acetyl-CoA-carboxylase] ligase